MNADSIPVRLIKWPLRPFVRLFVRMQNWYQFRKPRLIYQLFWRPRGYTWIEYYSSRLDEYVDVNAPVSESFKKYIADANELAVAIKNFGLKPESKFLDYGCGSLRLGYYLINYLNHGNYYGIDISSSRIKKGKAFLHSQGIAENCSKTFVVKDCLLNEINGLKFDFVWAHSVFTHMPREDILQMLASLKSKLSAKGQFLFTFSHNVSTAAAQSQPMKKSRIIGKDYYHTFDDMKAICEQVGYCYEVLDAAWPVGFSAVAKVTLPSCS